MKLIFKIRKKINKIWDFPQAENGFRQTVVFCFDAGERFYFDVNHLLLLCAECGVQAVGSGSPALCPGKHLLLHPERGRAAQAPLSPFPSPVSQPLRAPGCLLQGSVKTSGCNKSKFWPAELSLDWRTTSWRGEVMTCCRWLNNHFQWPWKDTCPQPLSVFPSETVNMSSSQFPTCLGRGLVLNYFYQHDFCSSFHYYFSF